MTFKLWHGQGELRFWLRIVKTQRCVRQSLQLLVNWTYFCKAPCIRLSKSRTLRWTGHAVCPSKQMHMKFCLQHLVIKAAWEMNIDGGIIGFICIFCTYKGLIQGRWCPSVHMLYLQNCWTDLEENWSWGV